MAIYGVPMIIVSWETLREHPVRICIYNGKMETFLMRAQYGGREKSLHFPTGKNKSNIYKYWNILSIYFRRVRTYVHAYVRTFVIRLPDCPWHTKMKFVWLRPTFPPK